MTTTHDDARRLIEEAAAHRLSGWDWSWIRERWGRTDTPWNYRELAAEAAARARALLDLDTGGGELLETLLRGLPAAPEVALATEAYLPNEPLAAERLAPLGVDVVVAEPASLPLADAAFDTILDRHGSFDAAELHRVLAPGGVFLTQQVGPSNFQELNEFLVGSRRELDGPSFEAACEQLDGAGLVVDEAEQAFIPSAFYDVGAVAFYLLGVPWQVPGFDPLAEAARMQAVHEHILSQGSFRVTAERYLIRAHRPSRI